METPAFRYWEGVEAMFFESCKRNYECTQWKTKPPLFARSPRAIWNTYATLSQTKVIEHVKIFTSLETSEAKKAQHIKLLLKITQPDIEMKLPQLC